VIIVEVEEQVGPPRGLLLGLGLIGLVVGGAIAGEFVLRVQPALGAGGAVAGGVIMPVGVGSNTALTYSPSKIVVVIGVNNTVTFTNKDSVTHTVTATDNSFNSGDIKAGQSWTNTFTTAGTFSFYCIYHSWMKGTIVVESSASGNSSSTNSTSTGFTIDIPEGTGSNTSLNYAPSSVTLVAGVNNTVTFVNNDSTKHTVTDNNGAFNSGDILPGQSWTYTFPVGNYSFHCMYHTWMKGNITVIAGSG